MIEKTFCEECRNDVEYTTASVPMTGTIKGKEYHYTGTEARCADCGSLVFVPEITDDNLQSLYNTVQEKHPRSQRTYEKAQQVVNARLLRSK